MSSAVFATVGSQMPFDRLIRALDGWAARHPAVGVFAQIGDSPLQPQHIESCRVLAPEEFRGRVAAARVIVAHAGMGSVLTALEFGKPLVLLPRRGELRETRNDHQVATARWLASKPGIEVALDEAEFDDALARALERGAGMSPAPRGPAAEALIGFLSRYADDLARERVAAPMRR
ncbi:glycosyltransferase [Aquabacterium humicola]|uniref:glycosyltransferase n=1 Tax=Aquabacterium humicola TaxID=3237377 RepID=UPI002542B370|nr:glycosyltransferase [Rubrivivax pictus]